MSKKLIVEANEGAEIRGIKRRSEGPYLSDKVDDMPQGSTLIYEDGPFDVLKSENSIEPISVYKVRSSSTDQVGAVPVGVVRLHNSGWVRTDRKMASGFDSEILISDHDYENILNSESGDIIDIEPSFMRDSTGNTNGVIIKQTYDVLDIEGEHYEVVSVTQPSGAKIAEPNFYKKGIPVKVQVRKMGP